MASDNRILKKTIADSQNIHSWKRRLRDWRKTLLVTLYLWLFINNDPIYAQRVLGAMMASRLIHRTLRKFSSGVNQPTKTSGNGLSPIEVIALIQAMNSNNAGGRGGGGLDADILKTLRLNNDSRTGLATRQQSEPRQEISNRQIATPTPRVAPVVALTSLLAFLTAVLTGAGPVAAFAAAAAAAAAAAFVAFVALIALIIVKKQSKKSSPLIKKLVIKKTVLPIVIPIPIKKNEKKIIYKYNKKPEHHDHEEYEYKKKKYKHKKMDVAESEQRVSEPDMGHLSKLEPLLREQDRLQSLVDNIMEDKKPDTMPRRRAK